MTRPRDPVTVALEERCGGWCEIRHDGCTGRAQDPSHRVASGRCGPRTLSNLLAACRACHDWCHAHPIEARARRWHLDTGQDPATTPAWIHHPQLGLDWWLLDDDGTYHPTPTPLPPPTADPDRACDHEHFDAVVEVCRVTASDDDPTVVGYTADIRVTCASCQEPFRWCGVPVGASPAHPMCSVDERTLRAPLRPASADPDFGLGLPGFTIRYRPGEVT